jgi:hypothetical protein
MKYLINLIAIFIASPALAFTSISIDPPSVPPDPQPSNISGFYFFILYLAIFYLVIFLTTFLIWRFVYRKVNVPFWSALLILNILLLVSNIWIVISGYRTFPVVLLFALSNIAFSYLGIRVRQNKHFGATFFLTLASIINIFLLAWFIGMHIPHYTDTGPCGMPWNVNDKGQCRTNLF